MTKTDKIPKHWEEMNAYRCYYRSFGPMTLKLTYSSFTDKFNARLVLGFDTLAKELYRDYTPDKGESDARVMRKMEYEAKNLIRSWAK